MRRILEGKTKADQRVRHVVLIHSLAYRPLPF